MPGLPDAYHICLSIMIICIFKKKKLDILLAVFSFRQLSTCICDNREIVLLTSQPNGNSLGDYKSVKIIKLTIVDLV